MNPFLAVALMCLAVGLLGGILVVLGFFEGVKSERQEWEEWTGKKREIK